jgi:hypothetical protein
MRRNTVPLPQGQMQLEITLITTNQTTPCHKENDSLYPQSLEGVNIVHKSSLLNTWPSAVALCSWNKRARVKLNTGNWRYSSTVLKLDTRWRCLVSFMNLRRFTPRKQPRYPLYRRLGGPQESSWTLWRAERSHAPAGNRTPSPRSSNT